MDSSEYVEVRAKLHAMSDEALLRLLAFQREEYRQEAVEIATEELLCRKITPLTAQEYRARFGLDSVGFCQQCLADTIDEKPEPLTRLGVCEDKCPQCLSVVQTAWPRVSLIRIKVVIDKYRVLYEHPESDTGKWTARKIKREA